MARESHGQPGSLKSAVPVLGATVIVPKLDLDWGSRSEDIFRDRLVLWPPFRWRNLLSQVGHHPSHLFLRVASISQWKIKPCNILMWLH